MLDFVGHDCRESAKNNVIHSKLGILCVGQLSYYHLFGKLQLVFTKATRFKI